MASKLKINLPVKKSSSESVISEAMALKKMDVIKESLVTFRAVVDLLKSIPNLKATALEWEGKVAVAEAGFRTAEVSLHEQKVQSMTRMAELQYLRDSQQKLFELFDELLRSFRGTDIDSQRQGKLEDKLLALGEMLVKLK